ncbi:MAG: Bug family tripartite tricarboxylate transporter substrate binding protein [Rhodospirillaceae bacterium]
MRRLASLPLLASTLVAAFPLCAQQFPAKPIRIIIPFPPGDSLDTMSRLIGPKLTERLGQNVVVDNRAGAAGQLGLELAAHAPADGYTLVGGQGGNLAVQPHTYRKLPYDPLRDFAPVALSTTNFLALVVNPNAPYATVKDLIAHAKANPGKVSFASNGEGGFPHMAIEMMRTQGGFTYLHVPYKGSVQILTELMAGRVDATILGIGALAPYIKAGRIRLLAVTSPERQELYPDTPALSEFLPGYDSRGWFGYLAPAGTPAKIVALLNQEINRAMSSPDVKEKMNVIGLTVVAESPEFFARTLKSDYEKYGKLIRDIGLQPQ